MTLPIVLELDIEIPDLADIEVETPSIDITAEAGPAPVLLVVSPGPPGIQGPPGEGAPILGETPSGLLNGTNTVFTTASAFQPNTTGVYLNGLREFNFVETSSQTITLADPPLPGDILRIDYIIL